jgi:hypothetical protein
MVLLRETEFTDVSGLLQEGFFADRIVERLQKPGSVNHDDKKLLVRVQTFLDKILDGEEQVGSAKLSSASLESVDAYHRAIVVFQQALTEKSEDITKPNFKKLIKTMTDEVSHALEHGQIEPTAVNTTLAFFKHVRYATLRESSEYFSRRDALKWPTRPTY